MRRRNDEAETLAHTTEATSAGRLCACPPGSRQRPTSRNRRAWTGLVPAFAVLAAVGTASGPSCAAARPPLRFAAAAADADAFLDALQARTFRYFWELANPANGLVPDRAPTPSFSSVAAVGFGLTAYPIGAERGYVTRAEARHRVLSTLRFLADAPQGPAASGVAGHRGFFYHFLDMRTGARFEQAELSSLDTALLLAGVLFCQSYFDGANAEEAAIRETAEALYRRVDWRWAQPRAPAIAAGWGPESGFGDYDYHGYNEAMVLYVLALGSPTHPVDEGAWREYTRRYVWGRFQGQEYLAFAPLFGHQYSHVWIDFRGIQDAYMRGRGIDYFENSRRAAYAHRAYAIANPLGFKGYGENLWGLTACDGPTDATIVLDGRPVRFYTYAARGASIDDTRDDGTIAPTAAAASLPFAPEIVVPALLEMQRRYGDRLFSTYGFLDAFNPSFTFDMPVRHGHVDPAQGWFDTDYLGIDQGPIFAMIENHRSRLVWEVMKKNPHVRRGLRRAGFAGGWLDAASPGAN